MRLPTFLCLALLLGHPAASPGLLGQEVAAPESMMEIRDIPYRPDPKATPDLSQHERCQLDLRHPKDTKGFSTVIWFHGGGLTAGKRAFPEIKDPSIAIVSAGYRLSPEAILPDILDDAASVAAWTFRHIADYGGDPGKVFIAGHSAGGYLAALVGMDGRWMEAKGLSHRQFAGIVPVSAQMTTHFHVKRLRGDTGEALRPLIDEFAPLYHVSKALSPICLVVGDRKIEFKSRVEENDLMAVTLRHLGHPLTEYHEVPGEDHGSIGPASAPFIEAFVKRVLKEQGRTKPERSASERP